MKETLLKINNLNIKFKGINGSILHAVNGVNLSLEKGESLGIVGESGSGKSQTMLSLMGLLASNSVVSGEAFFEGKNLLDLKPKELNKIRGTDISMIFQDPMTSLNPYLKISTQMIEVVSDKHLMTKKEAKQKALDMLSMVGLNDVEKRFNSYPHQLSGGMRQRVMIAMAILSNPKLLIADEPTTALDVTIQAQILDLISNLRKELGLSVIMITHDLGVVANLCNKIAIFYGGKIVEYGTSEQIFYNPKHPYTKALLNSIPRLDQDREKRLTLIPGNPPQMYEPPKLCVFKDRCLEKFNECEKIAPHLIEIENGRCVSCLKEELNARK